MAIRFDSSADSLTRSANLPSTASAFTVCFWVYLSSDINTYGGMFARDDAADIWIGVGPDGTTLRTAVAGNESPGSALSLNTWYHVALTRNGNDVVAYLNGVSDITDSRAISITNNNMWIGNDGFTEPLDGRIQDFKMWTSALSAAEINQEMFSSRAVRRSDLYCEGIGSLNGSARNEDLGPNGYDWTANGTLTDETPTPTLFSIGQVQKIGNVISVSGFSISPALLSTQSNLYSPDITPELQLAPDVLNTSINLQSHTISGELGITVPLLSTELTFYDPSIDPEKTISPPALLTDTSFPAVIISLPGGSLFEDDGMVTGIASYGLISEEAG